MMSAGMCGSGQQSFSLFIHSPSPDLLSVQVRLGHRFTVEQSTSEQKPL